MGCFAVRVTGFHICQERNAGHTLVGCAPLQLFTLGKVAPPDSCCSCLLGVLCGAPSMKSLRFLPLGQSQWAEVMCHCHPCPEGLVYPSAHLGSPQRMGKAPCD